MAKPLSAVRSRYIALPLQARAALWFLICGFLQKGISVITTPIFTRLMTTSEYGQFSVFNSWLGIAQVVVTLNLSAGVYSQGLVKFEDRRDVWSSSLQGLSLALSSAWAAAYLLAPGFWNGLLGLTTPQVLAMLCMCWASTAFSFWSADQRVDYRYRALVAITLAASVAKPAVGVLLVLNAQDKVTARILGLAAVELLLYSWTFAWHMRRGRAFYSAEFWRYALLFNLPLIPHYLSQVVLASSDRIMIASLVGESEAGVYNLAYQVSQVMRIFNTALLQTVTPWIYRKLRDGRVGDLPRVAYPSFAFVAAANLVLIALAPEAVALFAPAQYADAIWAIPPVAMSVYLTFSYTFFATFEFYFEKTALVSVATVAGAVANLALNSLLLPRLGYVAAGYTTLACYLVFAALHYAFATRISRERFGTSPYSGRVLLSMTAALLALGFAFTALYRHPLLRYAALAAGLGGCLLARHRVAGAARALLAARGEGKAAGNGSGDGKEPRDG